MVGSMTSTTELELAVVIGDWLDHLVLERGHAELTREAYARDLGQFSAFLSRQLDRPVRLSDLAALKPGTFRGFMASRRAQGASSRSLSRTMSALRTFFRWLEAEQALKKR